MYVLFQIYTHPPDLVHTENANTHILLKSTDQLVATLGGGQECLFLFVQLTFLQRWNLWAALVWHEPQTWRSFIMNTLDGQSAARRVFRKFPTAPVSQPKRFAWQETRAAMIPSNPSMECV